MLVLHFFVVFILVGVLGAWFVLASLIDPTRFLPYGTAVIVVVLVVKSTHAELTAAANYLKKACRNVFDSRFAQALRKAKADIQEEKQNQMANKMMEVSGGGIRKRQIMWEEDLQKPGDEEDQGRKPSPGDLFSVLDKNDNGEVSLEEFKRLLRKL